MPAEDAISRLQMPNSPNRYFFPLNMTRKDAPTTAMRIRAAYRFRSIALSSVGRRVDDFRYSSHADPSNLLRLTLAQRPLGGHGGRPPCRSVLYARRHQLRGWLMRTAFAKSPSLRIAPIRCHA